MARVLLILALVATAFWVFTIVDVSVQPAARHRGVTKPIWILIVILLPVLGGLLWLTVGRVRRSTLAARRAPDDDPEFLGKIGTLSDQDERIRRLEEELAQLDAEADDPRWTAGGDAKPAAPEAATPGTVTPEAPTRGTDRPAEGDDDTRGQRGAVG
ncbi:PLD nuclease N-terminal domain-containing protein [Microbacterium pygmaeum]|uniref:Phospholipase_D-nuclease N-terminal n=1 Tax=Microbacterium pygmaeum TaxID=370764 RepID=A0A1G7X154_9MICO|nr:PLD nuclease N-terminal domain-containing protein [Microbacterium pygmaeum]SDG77310.1 Phospholipase_D-nuclease N-terminal [Microbacterium pygmaeum]